MAAALECCRHERKFGPSERTALYKYLRDPAQRRACIRILLQPYMLSFGFPGFRNHLLFSEHACLAESN